MFSFFQKRSVAPDKRISAYRGHLFQEGKCLNCLANEKSVRYFDVPCMKAAAEVSTAAPVSAT